MTTQPPIVAAGNPGRVFAASATALQAILVDQTERILLMLNSDRHHGWTVVSGALEAGETILDGVLRETREETGSNVRARPLGVVHAQTFHYDTNVRYMLGIHYLLAYEGGTVEPGDDMAGSDYRWSRLAELKQGDVTFAPSTSYEILNRAIDLYRLWKEERDFPLQVAID